MPTSASTYRAASALVLATLAFALVAAPASAAGKTRWVDDDGKAGSAGCDAKASAFKTVQKAVTASGAGDTVRVCPGTYVGFVTISGARDGLVLKSTKPHKAILKAPAEAIFDTTHLVTVDNVDKVTVSGFALRPLRATSHSFCDWSTGIRALDARTLSIIGNDVRPAGSGPFCGIYDGIALNAGTTGTVSGNVIKDYRNDGIHIEGAGTDVTIKDNAITFAHVGLNNTGGSGVQIITGAIAIVRGNTITGPAAGPGNPPQPQAGVRLSSPGAATVIRANTISARASDIEVHAANGVIIRDNVLTGGQVALNIFNGDGMSVFGNVATLSTVNGLYVAASATGNNVHDNDFRVTGYDCQGETADTGPNNTWTDKLGNQSNPSILCGHRPPG